MQAALDWELQTNEGNKPKLAGAEPDVFDNTQETKLRFGIDHYKIERFERQEKRWKTCLLEYRGSLFDSFLAMNNSAQYGLTQAQADAILGNMALIQSVLGTDDGIISKNQKR